MPPSEPSDDDLTRLHRVPEVAKLRAEAFIIAKKAGIDDRQSRMDLAEWILRRDVTTWSDLSRLEWMRLVDSLRGWLSVQEMRRQSGLRD